MNEPRVRLLFHDLLGTRERLAALAGARAFARFGVIYDCAGANKAGVVRHVKAGERLRALVNAEKPTVALEDLRYESEFFWASIFTRSIIGVGITPNPLQRLLNGSIKTQNVLGLSLRDRGALFSTSAFAAQEPGICSGAIRAGVQHELGHVFGVNDHCGNTRCIMQENTNYADFIERFVKPALGFCRDCQAKIGAGVSRAMLP